MTSKLTSLLKYRFVKRDGKSESSESGSQSSENGSQSDTQPPSETSTQAPVTPDKKPVNLQITPGSKNTSSTEPLSSPDSPIFSTRPKLIDRNWGATPDKDSASSSSSTWLSKENGQIANGHSAANRRGARKYPSFSDGESDDDTTGIEDYDGKMERLKSVFPVKMKSEIKQALIDKGGDLDGAIDVLIGSGKSKFKRIRKHSQESTSDPDTPTQPRKRIRKISSDSGDEDGVDSQATESYGLESQRSDATIVYEVEDDNSPLTDDQEKQIKFLKNCFKDKSRQELRRVLSQHDWCVADATVAMSAATTLKAVTSENKIRAKAAASVQETKDIELDDEDDDYGSGNESEGSDDSIEEEGDAGRNVILDFFADASLEELMATPGCSKKKSELIVSHRPFASWEDLVDKFVSVKGLSYDLISGCREVIKIRDTVIRLMQRCEKISSTMEQVVSNLIHSNTLVDDSNHITQQPSNLNPDMQLKPFQMVGLNWLRVMHSQELNGILADEMGLGKTVQTVAFLAHLLEEGHMGPHVIIVPSSTIDNWIREAKVWCPTMKVLVYYGSQEDRRATRQYIMYNNADNFNVIITTYNMATGSVEDRALFKKFEFHYAIFDEGHLLKNMSSLRYQNLMRVTAYRRLLLTGTPLQNNLLELMSLLCFVMPDMFVGKTEPLKRMFTTISRTGNDEKRSHYEQERIAHAKRIMKPFVLRRLKSEVMSQLPSKSERVQYCKMIPSQQELYDNLIHNFSVQMTATGVTASAAGAGAAMLMKLRKAANHPLLHRTHYSDKKIEEMAKKLCEEPSHKDRGALPKLISEDMQVMSDFELHKCCIYYKSYLGKYMLKDSLIKDSGKFHVLDGLLDKHQALDHRVLLFSQFTTLLDIMELFLKQKHIKFIRLDGSTAVVERQKLIDQYNNDKSIYVFLLSTKAGGLGINLTSANVVILHDIDFNPYNDKQAEDRCHRVGQTREVQIVRLISQSTVEEAMLKCGQEKLKLEKDVISTDGTDSDTGNIKDVASILKQALHAQTVRLNS